MKELLCTGLLAAFFALNGYAKIVDGVAANINGQAITIQELRIAIKTQKKQSKDYMTILERMIEEKLVAEEITKRGLNATDAEVEDAVAQIRKQNFINSDAELEVKLREQGMTLAQFKKGLLQQIERGKFVNYVMGRKD